MKREASWKAVFAELVEGGWRLQSTKRGHVRCLSPCGEFVVHASGDHGTGKGDPRGLANFLRDLRRTAGWHRPGIRAPQLDAGSNSGKDATA